MIVDPCMMLEIGLANYANLGTYMRKYEMRLYSFCTSVTDWGNRFAEIMEYKETNTGFQQSFSIRCPGNFMVLTKSLLFFTITINLALHKRVNTSTISSNTYCGRVS